MKWIDPGLVIESQINGGVNFEYPTYGLRIESHAHNDRNVSVDQNVSTIFSVKISISSELLVSKGVRPDNNINILNDMAYDVSLVEFLCMPGVYLDAICSYFHFSLWMNEIPFSFEIQLTTAHTKRALSFQKNVKLEALHLNISTANLEIL